jgi:hypothetical protein
MRCLLPTNLELPLTESDPAPQTSPCPWSRLTHFRVPVSQYDTPKRLTLFCCLTGISCPVHRHLLQGWSRLCSGFVRPSPAFLRQWPNEG